MKKIIQILAIFTLAFVLTACGLSEKDKKILNKDVDFSKVDKDLMDRTKKFLSATEKIQKHWHSLDNEYFNDVRLDEASKDAFYKKLNSNIEDIKDLNVIMSDIEENQSNYKDKNDLLLISQLRVITNNIDDVSEYFALSINNDKKVAKGYKKLDSITPELIELNANVKK